VKQGSGLEFADYRPFSPGDDIRAIDWGVYARSRHILLKLFEEEEDLHVHLLLDCSFSMSWGAPAKFDSARQIVAGLAYLALANLDRSGITPLGPSPQAAWQPSRGRAKFLSLLRFLQGCNVSTGQFELSAAVSRWLATRPRRGMVIWVTDGWGADLEDLFLALDRLRYARHDIGVIQIRHADEARAGDLGEFEYQDIETGTSRVLVVDHAMAAAYEAEVAAYEARLKDYCHRHGIAHLQADAAESAIDILQRSLLKGGFVR